MPELPDVETFRRYFDATSLGRRIETIDVRNPRILSGITPEALTAALTGRSFTGSERLGKNLLARISDGPCLLLHFGMSGYLKSYDSPSEEPSHPRLIIGFADDRFLAYDNRRMIGRVGLVASVGDLAAEKGLGPDALAVSRDEFLARLSGFRGKIKPALMDQSFVAGVGNVYADEILFHCSINPQSRVESLTDDERELLYREMRRVLNVAVEAQADAEAMPGDFLLPHRKATGSCPRCGSHFAHAKVGGRTTYYCPRCQYLP